MDASKRTAAYMATHKINEWFRAIMEDLVVSQPQDPMMHIHLALAREIETREQLEEGSKKQVDGSHEKIVSVVARIAVTGRDGARQDISFNRVANRDMMRGARGARMMREWGSMLGSLLTEVLLGSPRHDTRGDNGTSTSPDESANAASGLDPLGIDSDLLREWMGEGKKWVVSDAMRTRLKAQFDQADQDSNGVIDDQERGGLKDRMRDEVRMLLIEFGIGVKAIEKMPSGLSFPEFVDWFLRLWETAIKEQALVDLDITRIVVEALGGGSSDLPLGGLLGMSVGDIAKMCIEKVAPALEAALANKRAEVIEQARRMSAGRRVQGKGNDKFAIQGGGIGMAKFGSIDDFHNGISAQLGLPNANLREGMEAEHCRRQDSKDTFNPGNYDTTTTPSEEWVVVTDETRAKQVSVGDRRVKPLKELMVDTSVKKAGLMKEEVLALLLYTGPMFYKYNTVLRGMPAGALEGLKGNKYTTTIHCIVSGIIKLSKVMRLPDNRKVYRGLGGLALPKAFTTPDECGIMGGVEFAMLSTTTDRKVALQYAGDNMPILFEISVGAIDRGASLDFLSQYPHEEEILLPPRSYLEVQGSMSRTEAGEDGRMVRIMCLNVNANAASSTIEQIIGKRKEIFVSAGENALDEIRSRLDTIMASERYEKFVASSKVLIDKTHSGVAMTRSILTETKEWLARHHAREVGWFNDEGQHSRALRELSVLERMAIGKMEFWLAGGMLGVFLIDQPMERVARIAESDIMGKIERLVLKQPSTASSLFTSLPSVVSWYSPGQSTAAKVRELALELCKRRGAIIQSVDETNDLGEPPLVACGAKGDVAEMRLLLLAGCKVDTACVEDGSTALHRACTMGHVEYTRRLIDEGADIFKKDEEGKTGLLLAVERGHIGVVELMLERGGKELGMISSNFGMTNALAAVFRDGCETLLLQKLVDVCGQDLLLSGQFSAALGAVYLGKVDILRCVYELGGRGALMKLDHDGWSCAQLASYHGHLDIVRCLSELCGQEHLVLVQRDGWSCTHVAASHGSLNIVEYVHEQCGPDQLMLVDKDAKSCAFIAAENKHVDIVRYLTEACGLDHLMRVDKYGRSCAHAAASAGSLETIKYVHEQCGPEHFMMADKNGRSCAHAAAAAGSLDIVKYVHEQCGRDHMTRPSGDGSTPLMASVRHKEVCEYLVGIADLDVVSLKDVDGWTLFHSLVYSGDVEFAAEIASKLQADAVLDAAKDEVPGLLKAWPIYVHRGPLLNARLSHRERTVEMEGVCSLRSRRWCPCGSRGYYELEIITLLQAPAFGFASPGFEHTKEDIEGKGVGDDSFSWSVDGIFKVKKHRGFRIGGKFLRGTGNVGSSAYPLNDKWKDGDVIGLACDLVEGKLHVSVNGDYSSPNGCVFEVDVEACKGLFAAFSSGLPLTKITSSEARGKVRYNLGEETFKHSPPPDGEYLAFIDLPLPPNEHTTPP